METRSRRQLGAERIRAREAFLALLTAEGRSQVAELGCGAGQDGVALAGTGLSYCGIDLSPAAVRSCRALGLDAVLGNALELPLRTDSHDAAWSMSTLLHLPDRAAHTALAELARVCRPGALAQLGLWGSNRSREERWRRPGATHPARYFRLRSDPELRALVDPHADTLSFRTWPGEADLHYQAVVLRFP